MGHHEGSEHHAGISLAAPLIGAPAPAFKGAAYFNGFGGEGFKDISLEDYKGKWLVLFFYPAAFTGVCQSEIKAFSEEIASFSAEGAEIIAVSGDTQFALKAWAASGELGEVKFPLLADVNHYTGAAYRVYDCPSGLNYRGLFIINPEGVIMYAVQHHFAIGRSTGETLRVLQALKSGGACLVNWKK
jgi:peroxiredoxin (alkyl hydroperoxide reductase subunit C)